MGIFAFVHLLLSNIYYVSAYTFILSAAVQGLDDHQKDDGGNCDIVLAGGPEVGERKPVGVMDGGCPPDDNVPVDPD